MINNETFLKTLFGDDYYFAHVTSFPDDPSNIANENRLRCWAGGWFKDMYIPPDTNQYFTISTFMADDQGKARRRKALFRCTHVIVADDVREKLDINTVRLLPAPTYKLQTSPGSEQWGWVLDYPCVERHKVENLLDGLVAKGLAPDGKDPGMKGVTRYVRLPDGVNSKSSKLVAGQAQKCIMLEWQPELKVSIESLAEPFGVDLYAERRESRVDGAADVSDHPILGLPFIHVKEIRSDGRFDIKCPWVSEHTGAQDDGAAVFTNNDGTIGFKCHHGACQERTGRNLLEFIEERNPGFTRGLDNWRILRSFGISKTTDNPLQLNNGENGKNTGLNETAGDASPGLDFMGGTDPQVSYQDLIDHMRRIPAPMAIDAAYAVLQAVDGLDHGSRLNYWGQVRDHMDWTKPDLQNIIDQQREIWYPKQEIDTEFYDEYVYVAEQNQFYNPAKNLWLPLEAFHNRYAHIDEAARAEAIVGGRVQKVDRLDYAPGMPKFFTDRGVTHANGWSDNIEKGVPGDASLWLDHFDKLGWSEHKDHILKWMAFTLRHPEQKINHCLLLAGGEGNGKDFILHPLMMAMGSNAKTVDGNELLNDFNDYILSTKYLHVNEAELGDYRDAKKVTAKLKPYTCAPPSHLRVNRKSIVPVSVRNIINVSMTSNSAMPLNLSNDSRRYYGVWSDVTIRGADGQVTPYWQQYWNERWKWIRDMEGWKCCVWYLFNCVDLSDFDPGRVPIVTDFVREIQSASSDPITVAIKELIDGHMGVFQSDIVTAVDVRNTLKTGAMFGVDLKNVPNKQIIGKIIKEGKIALHARAWKGKKEIKLWIVRNFDKYENMSGSQLADEYERQISAIRTEKPFGVVNG